MSSEIGSRTWEAVANYVVNLQGIRNQIQDIMEGKEISDQDRHPDAPSRTIFHELLKSDLPDEEKSLKRLWEEGALIVGGGADTTANAMTVITFHLLANPRVLETLRRELEVAIPGKYSIPALRDVENLPYLVSSR